MSAAETWGRGSLATNATAAGKFQAHQDMQQRRRCSLKAKGSAQFAEYQ